MSAWKTLSTRIAYQNPFMLVHEDQTLNPAGKPAIYGYCESTENSVYIAVVDSKDHMYLVEQFRYPLKRNSWEVVAGRIPHDEDITEGARRELLEETGYLAKRMKPMATFFTSPGILSEKMYAFVAYDLQKSRPALEEGEEIEVEPTALADAIAMIKTGEIADAKTIAVLLMFERFK